MGMSLKKIDSCGVNHLFNQKYRFLLLPTNPDLEGLKDDEWGLFAIAEIAQLLKQSNKTIDIKKEPTPTFIMRWINKDHQIKYIKTVYLYGINGISLALGVPRHKVVSYLDGNYIQNPLSVCSRPYSIHITKPEIPVLQTRLNLLQLTILATRLTPLLIKPKKEIQDYAPNNYRSWKRPTGLCHTHRFL